MWSCISMKDKSERRRLNLILYISGVVFIMLAMYYLLAIWDLKSINEPFVKGIVSFGMTILCFSMPYIFSRCKQCNQNGEI